MPTASRQTWMDAWEGDLNPSAAARRSAARVGARTSATRYYGREATARLPKPAPEAPRSQPLAEVKVRTTGRTRPWFMLAGVAAVALILLTVVYILPVMMNSSTTDLEAATGRLQSKQTELVRAGADLSAQVAGLSTPQRVAEVATKLGLQPAASVHYLQINAGMAVAEGTATVANR